MNYLSNEHQYEREKAGRVLHLDFTAFNQPIQFFYDTGLKKQNTYVMFLLVSMAFIFAATSMAVPELMLASPSLPESEPDTRVRWPLGTWGGIWSIKLANVLG